MANSLGFKVPSAKFDNTKLIGLHDRMESTYPELINNAIQQFFGGLGGGVDSIRRIRELNEAKGAGSFGVSGDPITDFILNTAQANFKSLQNTL